MHYAIFAIGITNKDLASSTAFINVKCKDGSGLLVPVLVAKNEDMAALKQEVSGSVDAFFDVLVNKLDEKRGE
jgi:hypothetical protein